MFTGLVADLGRVSGVERSSDGVVLTVESRLAGELATGDSISVNGVCLTATGLEPEAFRAEVMHETLRRSSLATLEPASRVNLELPLRAGDRLGGHMVQGHVDAVGSVRAVHQEGFARLVEIEIPGALERYIVEKGSIAVDGVSLTVAGTGERSFTVSLIPETLERTNLGAAGIGTSVNLEVDVLAKYVEKLLAR